MNQFIQVQYQNKREGFVDDITLDELIDSKMINRFYRPSEHRWVSVIIGPVRSRGHENGTRLSRRATDIVSNSQKKDGIRKMSKILLSKVFKNHKEQTPSSTELTPNEWFERGLMALRVMNNHSEAVREFAMSIRLDRFFDRAYLNRGIAYEGLGNLEQAIEDYTKAIAVKHNFGIAYFLRGLSLRRTGRKEEAISDLKKAADLGYRPAVMYLKSMDMFLNHKQDMPTEEDATV